MDAALADHSKDWIYVLLPVLFLSFFFFGFCFFVDVGGGGGCLLSRTVRAGEYSESRPTRFPFPARVFCYEVYICPPQHLQRDTGVPLQS